MIKKNYKINGADNIPVPITLWIPDGSTRCILHITHGMTEHIGRYEELAKKLSEQGIVTAGFDLPGHGENSGDPICASIGQSGWKDTLNNMKLLNQELKSMYPQLPLCMLGFSLGSFLLRDFLQENSYNVDAAIIMGTGYQPSFILRILKRVIKSQINKVGFDKTSPLVKKLSFETYNKKFRPGQTEVDWLCSDKSEREIYLNDPLCKKCISAGLFWQLLDGMERTGNVKNYKNWNKDLPVLLLSGAEDPVGNEGKGVMAVADQMKNSGLANVRTVLVPAGRHDILHEIHNGGEKLAVKTIEEFLTLL